MQVTQGMESDDNAILVIEFYTIPPQALLSSLVGFWRELPTDEWFRMGVYGCETEYKNVCIRLVNRLTNHTRVSSPYNLSTKFLRHGNFQSLIYSTVLELLACFQESKLLEIEGCSVHLYLQGKTLFYSAFYIYEQVV